MGAKTRLDYRRRGFAKTTDWEPEGPFAGISSQQIVESSIILSPRGYFNDLFIGIKPNNDSVGMEILDRVDLILVHEINLYVAGNLGFNEMGALLSGHPETLMPWSLWIGWSFVISTESKLEMSWVKQVERREREKNNQWVSHTCKAYKRRLTLHIKYSRELIS